MSKTMSEKELERKLSQAYKESGGETTSPELDSSIMAMAQQEVDAREGRRSDKSWWQRLRMPVSITAALVVTVGIARFMVELGYYHPDSIADSENQAQTATYSSEVTLQDDAVVLQAPPVPEKPAPAAKSPEQSIEKIRATGSEIAAEEKRLVRERQQQERQFAETEMVKRQQKKLQTEQTQVTLSVGDGLKEEVVAVEASADSAEGLSKEELESRDVETIEVTGSRVERVSAEPVAEDDINQVVEPEETSQSGTQEVLPAPALSAEEWLEQIKVALEEEDFEAAKAKWLDFRRAYPDYPVNKSLVEQLEGL
ncbi:hypothetical protein [Kangiella shandongensis]|uniref:hypothetical protein n=1 Tax=Kangiella shandongensis TaxID=2763258 RepID=UPI001CC15D6C|nr:hypothetical protein [Kangiella shandongensis]